MTSLDSKEKREDNVSTEIPEKRRRECMHCICITKIYSTFTGAFWWMTDTDTRPKTLAVTIVSEPSVLGAVVVTLRVVTLSLSGQIMSIMACGHP